MAGPAAAHLLSKAAICWSQWQDAHAICTQALSSASNILERLEPLCDAKTFKGLSQQPGVQQQVLAKQLEAFNKALALIHRNHETLKGLVKDMERLHIEALRTVSSASLEACASPTGPQPTAVECVETLHDMWVMCRDELLMKIAAVSLVTMDMAPADMAALLACYADQPNVESVKINTMLALLQETAQQQQQR